jgi:hypothetical protein
MGGNERGQEAAGRCCVLSIEVHVTPALGNDDSVLSIKKGQQRSNSTKSLSASAGKRANPRDIVMVGTKRKASDDAAEVDDRPGADSGLGLPTGGPGRIQPNPGRTGRTGRPAPGVSADGYFRHLYASEPDFKHLARQDSQFAAALQDNGQLDFSDPNATMQLTSTLLGIDFGLKLDLPEDRLCPPV